MRRWQAGAATALVLACGAALAQQGPRLGKVLQDQQAPKGGEPAQPFRPLDAKAWSYASGEYRSTLSGIRLRLPRIGDEKVVSVREAVGKRTPEGEIATSHVLIVPNADGAAVGRHGPVSAVVVTPLREGPREREAILKALEPSSPDLRRKLQARGVEYQRVGTGANEGLERIQPNRFVAAAFPYSMNVDEGAERVNSIGVTRLMVWRDQALLDFSQVFACGKLAPDACKAAARRASERFVQGFIAYEPVPASVRPHGPSSAPQQGK